MDQKIVLSADASVRMSDGVGIGYNGVKYESDGSFERVNDWKFIDKKMNTTDAETIAAAFAVKEIYDRYEEETGEYELVLRSDCKQTIRDVEESINDQGEPERVLRFFSKKFDDFKIEWISRESNEVANSLARAALERGSDGIGLP